MAAEITGFDVMVPEDGNEEESGEEEDSGLHRDWGEYSAGGRKEKRLKS